MGEAMMERRELRIGDFVFWTWDYGFGFRDQIDVWIDRLEPAYRGDDQRIGKFAIVAKPGKLVFQARRLNNSRFRPSREIQKPLLAWATELGLTPLPVWAISFWRNYEVDVIDWTMRSDPVECVVSGARDEGMRVVVVFGFDSDMVSRVRAGVPSTVTVLESSKRKDMYDIAYEYLYGARDREHAAFEAHMKSKFGEDIFTRKGTRQ